MDCCAGLVHEAVVVGAPRVVLAVGDQALTRSMGLDSAATWRGSVLESPAEVSLGSTKRAGSVAYKSGPKKGQPKPEKVELKAPGLGCTIIPTLNPADVIGAGLETLPCVMADLTRFCQMEQGKELMSPLPATVLLDPPDMRIINILGQQKVLSIDVETTGWEQGGTTRITLVGMAWEDGVAVFRPTSMVMSQLRLWFENPSNTVVGHNFGYDYKCFRQYGIEIKAKIVDTMHLAYWHRPFLAKGLEEVASRLTGFKYVNWKKQFELGQRDILTYNALDCCWTWHAWKELTSRVRLERRLEYWDRNINPMVPLVADLELRGVPIDRNVLEEVYGEQQKCMQNLQQKWEECAPGVNFASPKQLQVLLYEQFGIPKQRNLDKVTVARLAREFPDCAPLQYITAIRHASRMVKNYMTLDLTPEGRLLPQYNLSRTRTGRFSGGGEGEEDESSGFNFQNVPRSKGGKCEKGVEGCQCWRVREMVTGSKGKIVVGDWSQVEIRLAAWLAGENRLIEAFETPGFDVYQEVADSLGTTRAIAKVVVLGLNYGMGEDKLAVTTGLPLETCRVFIAKFRIKYPYLAYWRLELESYVKRWGYVVNPFGRRVYVKASAWGQPDVPKAIAGIPQSTCADMMLQTARKASEAGLVLLLMVHDELGVDALVGDEEERLVKVMEEPFEELGGFWCPAEVGTGRNWKEAKK